MRSSNRSLAAWALVLVFALLLAACAAPVAPAAPAAEGGDEGGAAIAFSRCH